MNKFIVGQQCTTLPLFCLKKTAILNQEVLRIHANVNNPISALPWELLYADDLIVITETEDDLIKRLNEWKDNMEKRGMRVNVNKTKVDLWIMAEVNAEGAIKILYC